MPTQEFARIFSVNLNHYLKLNDMTQLDLQSALAKKGIKVATSSISYWCSGQKLPRMDKVDAICDVLHLRRSDLINDKSEEDDSYYLNEEARDLAEFMHKNPDYKVLFDASRKVKPENLELVKQIIEKFGGTD